MKDQEQLCVDKYNKHASCAVDPQLKSMFSQIAAGEQSHLNMLTQMESGTVPQQETGSKPMPTFTAT